MRCYDYVIICFRWYKESIHCHVPRLLEHLAATPVVILSVRNDAIS